jgi:hypothetical protein
MEDALTLTDDELVQGLVDTFGMTERDARRQVAIARGDATLHPLEQPDNGEEIPLAGWLAHHH